VDVEPEEAQKLIGLIELLMKDWYVRRHEREESLAAIVQSKGRPEVSFKALSLTVMPPQLPSFQ
jgi:hypothetical protein